MGKAGKIIWLLAVTQMVLFTRPLVSQELWSEVTLNKSSVYVGEPVEVTITVYTSTWFTRGIDPGNIKVEGAFTTFFRPVSTSFAKDGINYAGVRLIYNVFPYSEKDILFPSLDISVETPPEGDFKGVAHVIKSSAKQIRVTPVPPGFDRDEWLVTTSLGISDNWQGNLQHVKVGDVLVRRITRTAQGTVSELIPPIRWDSVGDVGMYQARSSVQNNKAKTAISAVRTETMRFLFEKEGEVTIPEMVFSWYDPVRKQLYKRTLNEVTIRVQPNPNLGVLASVRDSLMMEQSLEMQDAGEKVPFTIMGLSPERFALGLLLALLLLIVIVRIMRRVIKWERARRKRFRNSEAFYFRQYTKSAGKESAGETLRNLYRWIDALHLPEPTLWYVSHTYGSGKLRRAVWKTEQGNLSYEAVAGSYVKEWRAARNRYRDGLAHNGNAGRNGWINPVNRPHTDSPG